MEDKCLVRSMTMEDVDAVTLVATRCFDNPWNKEDYVFSVEAEYDIGLVAEVCNNVAGFCIIRRSFENADVIDVAVDPDYRRRGIGATLIDRMFLEGKKAGVTDYMLEVRAGNEKAIKLYSRAGFEECGIRKNYYSTPVEDAIIMSISIQ